MTFLTLMLLLGAHSAHMIARAAAAAAADPAETEEARAGAGPIFHGLTLAGLGLAYLAGRLA